MRKLAICVFAVAITISLAYAKEGGKSSSSSKAITGCLSGPNSEGAYVLKTAKGSVEVGGNDQLKDHVGHEVKLTGSWAKSGAAIGENESAEKKESGAEKGEKSEKGERHFKAEKIDMVSASCSTQ